MNSRPSRLLRHQLPAGNSHIEFARSGDGLTWSSPVRVDDGAAAASVGHPSISAVAGTLWVTWDDTRNGNRDIFASWSSDGTIWGDGFPNNNDFRVDDTNRNAVTTDDATEQGSPVLRTSGYGVSVAWEDFRSAVESDPIVRERLSAPEVKQAFDLRHHLKHLSHTYDLLGI